MATSQEEILFYIQAFFPYSIQNPAIRLKIYPLYYKHNSIRNPRRYQCITMQFQLFQQSKRNKPDCNEVCLICCIGTGFHSCIQSNLERSRSCTNPKTHLTNSPAQHCEVYVKAFVCLTDSHCVIEIDRLREQRIVKLFNFIVRVKCLGQVSHLSTKANNVVACCVIVFLFATFFFNSSCLHHMRVIQFQKFISSATKKLWITPNNGILKKKSS